MANMQSIITELEKEWAIPEGFFFRLRKGFFDSNSFERIVQLLLSVELEDKNAIDRRFVALTWKLPRFMEWQTEIVQAHTGNTKELQVAVDKIENLLNEILGLP